MSVFDSLRGLKKPTSNTSSKKQVILRNTAEVDLYYKVKGKMQSQQKTFSDWLVDQMRKEIYPNHE